MPASYFGKCERERGGKKRKKEDEEKRENQMPFRILISITCPRKRKSADATAHHLS